MINNIKPTPLTPEELTAFCKDIRHDPETNWVRLKDVNRLIATLNKFMVAGDKLVFQDLDDVDIEWVDSITPYRSPIEAFMKHHEE